MTLDIYTYIYTYIKTKGSIITIIIIIVIITIVRYEYDEIIIKISNKEDREQCEHRSTLSTIVIVVCIAALR